MAGCWQLVTVYWHAWDRLRRCAFGACVFMLKGMRFMPRAQPYSVKTNVLKKCVVVLIRKIILPLISLSSKLVTYTLILVAIYIFRRPVSSTQGIDIVLIFQNSLRCCHVSTCWKSVSRQVFFINTIPETLFTTYKRFPLPTRGLYIITSNFNSHY